MQLDPTTDASFVQEFMPGRPRQEDDANLIVTFFLDAVLLGFKSEEAKRPIYEDRLHVEIKIKGQDKQIVVREATEADIKRFPIAHALFQQKKQRPMVGTPIELLPGVGPSLALHLKSLNLLAIEDLARVSDENVVQSIGMGARDLITRSKAWVAHQGEKTASLEQRLEQADRDNSKLLEIIKGYEGRIDALEKGGAPAQRPSARKIKKEAKAKKPRTH